MVLVYFVFAPTRHYTTINLQIFVPLKSKTATEVVEAYVDEMHAKFDGSTCILSDSGMELKNYLKM